MPISNKHIDPRLVDPYWSDHPQTFEGVPEHVTWNSQNHLPEESQIDGTSVIKITDTVSGTRVWISNQSPQ